MGLVTQIGKFPDGNDENRKWNEDMEKHPAMRHGTSTSGSNVSFSTQRKGWPGRQKHKGHKA
jgi:hypothetical protein